jgi:hypothetical protein
MRVDPWDLVGLAAVALIGCGIWLIHMPSALIFLGLICGAVYCKHEFDSARSSR